jgi:hypothetical protein
MAMKEFLAEMACTLMPEGLAPMQLLSTVKSGYNANWREGFHILSSAHANFRPVNSFKNLTVGRLT